MEGVSWLGVSPKKGVYKQASKNIIVAHDKQLNTMHCHALHTLWLSLAYAPWLRPALLLVCIYYVYATNFYYFIVIIKKLS